jgi:plastocyanin
MLDGMHRFLLSLVLAAAVAGPGITWVAPAGAADAAVTLTDRADPATLTVAPGTRVTFSNQSGDRKRIRSEDGPAEFDSGNIEAGAAWSVVLDAAGTYPYVDDRDRDDPAYHGTITVTPAAQPGGGTPNPPAPAQPPAGSPAPSAPATASVAILDRSFSPTTVTIAPGGSVSWTNQSDRDHTVTGTGFDSGMLGGGGRFSHTFPSAGTFSYVCELHSEMRASVTVTGNAGSAQPGPSPADPAVSSPAPSSGSPATTTAPAASAASPTSTTAPTAPVEATTPEVAEVSIVDLAFEPTTVRLALGGTVTWRHNGIAPHTVTADDSSFDSGLLRAGGTFSHRFDRTGTFRYICAFHSGMAGTVEIVDSPAAPAPDLNVGNGEQAASVNNVGQGSSPSGTAVLTALLGGAALLAGTGALLYGGSRMLAAGDQP